MERLMLSPTSPNQDLITVLTPPRDGILNQSIRNHLISTIEVTCLTNPCHPLKESGLATANPLFAHVTSLFLLPAAYKSPSLCSAPRSSFLSARLDAA